MSFANRTVGFIGAGAMAEALIKSLVEKKYTEPGKIWASDISESRLKYLNEQYGINCRADNQEVVKNSDVIIYAVKPFLLGDVLPEIARAVKGSSQLHVSVAAGISLSFIEQLLPAGSPVIRVMPNTPSLIGAGASAFSLGAHASSGHEKLVREILDCTGVSVKVPEHLLNAVTGLSGSGPAYVFMFIEALIDGGVKNGLPRDVASLLATQTVLGAARLVQETGEHPARLKDMVTTPGGTTIAALHILEEGGLRATVINAVEASAKRAEEMGAGK